MRIIIIIKAWLTLLLLSGSFSTLLFADEKSEIKIKEEKDFSNLPLFEQTEKLTFSTTEASWMSLDVSPDGKTILFDLLGDLYLLPIEGGKASRITQGLEYDAQPKFSPDGKWITYISDLDGNNNLWIAKSDGSNAKKLSSEKQNQLVSPEWTPDGQFIVATKTGNPSQLKLFHKDGGNGIVLSKDGANEGVQGVGATISHDGRYLYYSQRSSSNNLPSAQVIRYEFETGLVVPVTRGEGGGVKPVLSPDGKYLVYGSRYEAKTSLRIRNLITGSDDRLIWPIQRDSQERGGVPSRDLLPSYDFTPDGKFLVYNTEGKIKKLNIETKELIDIPFLVDVELDIGPDLTASYSVPQGDLQATIIHDPVLSPDGKKLAVSALAKIFTLDATKEAKPKRLTQSTDWEFNPVYSPDGRWIAYVTWSTEGGHIWKMRANGRGKPKKLTQFPAFYSDLTFSPDGKQILAVRGSKFQRQQLFSEFFGFDIPLDFIWLSAEGGNSHVIMPARGAREPHFAQEQTRIYGYDGQALFSIKYDGTDRKEHLSVTGPKGNSNSKEPAYANDIRISPDGKHALALVEKQVWLIPIVNIGDKPLSVNVRSPSVPIVQLTNIGADFISWADKGQTVVWAIGSHFYQRPLSSIQFGNSEVDKVESQSLMTLEDHEAVVTIHVNVTKPRNVPDGSIMLRGGNVITMAGTTTNAMNQVLENMDILVSGNRILKIAPKGQIAVEGNTEIVDISGQYVIPGLIDTHAHFEFRTQDVLEPHNWSLAANLAYGVTSGLDVQTNTKDYFTYRDLVETGETVGNRAFMTGPGIFGRNDFQSYEDTLAYLRQYSDHYKTRNIKSYVVGNRKQRQWIVQAAKELRLMPTTEGAGDMKLDITHAIDGMHGNEHTLPDGPIYHDVIELYAKTQIAYTPTLLVQYNGVPAKEYFFTRHEVHNDKKLQRFYPHNRLDEMTQRRDGWVRDEEFAINQAVIDAAAIQRAGGLVGIGGHGEVQGLGYHWEMWSFGFGDIMKPVEILRAATIDGAKIIGIDKDLGTIEKGKLADLVILDKNPLEDIQNTIHVDKVMKNGELFDGDTLNQLWPEQKSFTPFWWWDDIGISQ